MSELTDRLRQVARNASPGPWSYDAAEVVAEGAYNIAEGKPWYVVEVYDNGESGVQGGDDGRYIETFDPVLVSAMLDVIDAADAFDRISCEEWDHGIATKRDMAWWDDWEQRRARQLDALNAALARFREVSG